MDSDDEGVCEIGSRGSAASTKEFRERIIAVFNEGVRKGKITLANEWEGEWDPANQNLWQQVAWWIVHGHTFEQTVPGAGGQAKVTRHLAPGVAKRYFTGLMDLAKNERFVGNKAAEKFFECNQQAKSMESRTPVQHWYHGVKANVAKTAWDRANDTGELEDRSAKPIGPAPLERVVRHCTQMDNPEHSFWKLVMNSNRSLGGRPLEVCYLKWDKMKYEEDFFAMKLESPQVLLSFRTVREHSTC